jgi:Bax protein
MGFKITNLLSTTKILLFSITLNCALLTGSAIYSSSASAAEKSYEILVHSYQVEETIGFFKSRNFWGASTHGQDLEVPRIIIAVASDRWVKESQKIEVEVKKELFYRAIVPMILLSNELIQEERAEIEVFDRQIKQGKDLSQEQLDGLQALAERYQIEVTSAPTELTAQLLRRVDIIPPALALGQAAYESGYGTSRFAREGNALFGQWTYSGDGMKPKEHRAHKGDYGVASYRWPFDSVRSYMFNLNTHSAYQSLRDKRAALRAQGKEPTGLDLAETLESYSEKGKEYVETLKGIITVNDLAIVDQASLRDEPITITVGVSRDEKIEEIESKLSQLKASGELDRIVREMRLE